MRKVIIISIILALLLTGCKFDIASGTYTERIYVDKDTGVNYIEFDTNDGSSIIPRYNVDGSLYVSKQ